MAKDQFNPNNLPEQKEKYTTELEVRELIAAALANYTGVVRFRNVITTDVNIGDFTNAQHTHSNAAGGGQLNPANIFTVPVPVASGGTGVNTLTGIPLGSGASAFTAIVPLSGTKVYYVSDTSGGAVTRKLTFTNGVLTSET